MNVNVNLFLKRFNIIIEMENKQENRTWMEKLATRYRKKGKTFIMECKANRSGEEWKQTLKRETNRSEAKNRMQAGKQGGKMESSHGNIRNK